MSENKAEVGSDNAMADHKAEEGSNPEMEISSASVQLANLAPSEKIMYQGIDKGKSEDVLRGHQPDIEFKSERTRKKNATTKTGTSACLAPGCTTTRKIIISEVEGSGCFTSYHCAAVRVCALCVFICSVGVGLVWQARVTTW